MTHGNEFEKSDAELIDWWNSASQRILAVGSLKKQKGFHDLLHAMSNLGDSTDIRLIILGEGSERQELEELSHSLGLGHSVALPGQRANPDPFYAQADLFVLASRWEGFGNVIVEALGHGTPVLSTDCQSGPAEILNDGEFGTLVEPANPKALAQGILQSLEQEVDQGKLISRAADFEPKKVANQYLQLLFPEEFS